MAPTLQHAAPAFVAWINALPQVLRRFPYHAEASREESFRNPDGVAFKLQNLRQIAAGKGLGNVSETDRAVWSEFVASPTAVKSLTAYVQPVAAQSNHCAASLRRITGSPQE